ncbi:MAG TPA: SRPBCC family protein [Candidatus Saccharimonadales bacterium]
MMNKIFYDGPALNVLHDKYAKQGWIDKQASSVAVDSIDIDAPVQTVWSVLFAIDKWPTFNSIMSDVRLDTAVAVDAKGSFRLNGFPVTFTLAVVNPNHELTWTGKALWTKAVDRLWLEPLSTTTTRLHLEESLSGIFVSVISSNARLHKQHEVSLRCFKSAAEQITKKA